MDKILFANIFPIVCVVCATVLIITGHDNWLAFLILAALTAHTYSTSKKD